LNQDPLGEGGGIDLYTYVRNAPLNLFDAFGLQDGMANPANVAALEEATAAAEGYPNVAAYRAAKAAQAAAKKAADEAAKALLKRCTKNTGKIAKQFGRKEKEVRTAIEKLKQRQLRGGGGKGYRKNPDVQIDPKTGDAYPELPGGGLGDCIGNIAEFLL
jgi:uncharacterized protein RhaS with RHS repeats